MISPAGVPDGTLCEVRFKKSAVTHTCEGLATVKQAPPPPAKAGRGSYGLTTVPLMGSPPLTDSGHQMMLHLIDRSGRLTPRECTCCNAASYRRPR